MVGNAIVSAAEQALAQLKKYAGEMMECSEVDLEIRPGGFIGVKGTPDKALSYQAISGYAHYVAGGPIIGSGTFHYEGEETLDASKGIIKYVPAKLGVWSMGAQVVETEIDEETGRITPLRVWSAHDVG